MTNRGSAPHTGAASWRALAADDGIVIGEIGPACVIIWRKAVTQARIDLVGASLTQVIKHNAPGVAFLAVVEAGAEPPDEGLRRQMVAHVARHGQAVKCIVTVIEATGFAGAMLRGVVASLHMLDRRPNAPPRTTFRDVPAAAQWMQAYVPLNEGFAEAVEELRLQFAA